MLELMAGNPRIELGFSIPESASLKTKQYVIDYLGLFRSGITLSVRPYRYIKDMMIQEVCTSWVDPVRRSHPSICGS